MNRPPDPDQPLPELAALPRELPPPAGLEDRLAARLAARGVLRRRRSLRWLVPLAAALAGVVVGWSGRPLLPAPAPAPEGGGLYLLLLSHDPAGGPPEAERVELYRAWARQLAAAGRLAGAEKLTGEQVEVTGTQGASGLQPVGAGGPSGFFLVRAATLDAAVALARSSPHARLGGHVTVRPVDPLR